MEEIFSEFLKYTCQIALWNDWVRRDLSDNMATENLFQD